MFYFLRIIAVTMALLCLPGTALPGEPVSIAPQEGYLLLRNGNVLQGTVVHSGDRYYVSISGGQLVIKSSEVEFFCRELNEAYQRLQKGITNDQIGDRLKLARWCLRNQLYDEAADELAVARTIDTENPQLAMLERQLNFARRKPTRSVAPVSAETVPSSDELSRLIRGMPAGTVHEFAKSIQPMLINGCSTSHCHTGRSKSKFKLLRTSATRPASRRLTQRNLYSTLMLVDFDNVGESRLLTTLVKPHGGMKTPLYADPNAPAYRRLVLWCEQVANRTEPSQPRDVLQRSAPLLQRFSGPTAERKSPRNAGKSTARSTRDRTAARRPTADDPSQQKGKPSESRRTKNSVRFTPRDEFDPEIFNRRYFPPAEKP